MAETLFDLIAILAAGLVMEFSLARANDAAGPVVTTESEAALVVVSQSE